jgi:transposase
MPVTVTPQQCQVAKREIVRGIEQGVSAREARVRSAVPMHRTTVYRLLKRVQREGDNGFADSRHGHPVKLREEVLTFLIGFSQATPSVASSVLQRCIGYLIRLFPNLTTWSLTTLLFSLSCDIQPRRKEDLSLVHERNVHALAAYPWGSNVKAAC